MQTKHLSSTAQQEAGRRHPRHCLACAAMIKLTRYRLLVILALVAGVALGAALPGAFGKSEAEPTAIRNALAQTNQVQGAPGRTMVLSRVVVQPEAKLATHHHLGTQIARVQAGVLHYTVREGAAVVRSGESDQNPVLMRKIKAGQTAAIQSGQWIVEQPSDIHEAANRGTTPVVLYLATLLKDGAPPSTAVSLPPRD
jgi:quercetin dioxygenase-like cupin family protein